MELATSSCTGSFGLVLLLQCVSQVGRLQYRADGQSIRLSTECRLQRGIIDFRVEQSIVARTAKGEQGGN